MSQARMMDYIGCVVSSSFCNASVDCSTPGDWRVLGLCEVLAIPGRVL